MELKSKKSSGLKHTSIYSIEAKDNIKKLLMKNIFYIDFSNLLHTESKFYLKEVRNRGYQNKAKGVQLGAFASDVIPYNTFICELYGVVRTSTEKIGKDNKYIFKVNNFLIDCKDGGDEKNIRRSCRPNSQLKILRDTSVPYKKILVDKKRYPNNMKHIRFGVFSTKKISPNEEILLNSHISGKCMCHLKEYCLNDI
ncbi:hypothetical protein TCON_1884 [Astathelohania contejeani]|uniref:SET domain-containing protein n=1 Tax=Astathelohania contejeani TaxID=164912 RepID=A0ABQ7HXK3_9MICR|nr:hypothetical protein TCON_1884 [Thelohania contejeani]